MIKLSLNAYCLITEARRSKCCKGGGLIFGLKRSHPPILDDTPLSNCQRHNDQKFKTFRVGNSNGLSENPLRVRVKHICQGIMCSGKKKLTYDLSLL